MKRGINARGTHPLSYENPMHRPEYAAILPQDAGGNRSSNLMDPFGNLVPIDSRSAKSKKTKNKIESSVAPWENRNNVDSLMHSPGTVVEKCAVQTNQDAASLVQDPSACGLASRVPDVTGIWPQRRHVGDSSELKGTYAELEYTRHLSTQPPWATDAGPLETERLPSHYEVEVRKGASTAVRNARPTSGIKALLSTETLTAPWDSERSTVLGISHCLDWCSTATEICGGNARHSKRAADQVIIDPSAAGKPLAMDGFHGPGAHMSLNSARRALAKEPGNGGNGIETVGFKLDVSTVFQDSARDDQSDGSAMSELRSFQERRHAASPEPVGAAAAMAGAAAAMRAASAPMPRAWPPRGVYPEMGGGGGGGGREEYPEVRSWASPPQLKQLSSEANAAEGRVGGGGAGGGGGGGGEEEARTVCLGATGAEIRPGADGLVCNVCDVCHVCEVCVCIDRNIHRNTGLSCVSRVWLSCLYRYACLPFRVSNVSRV